MATVSTGPHITDETSVDQSFMDTAIMHHLYIFGSRAPILSLDSAWINFSIRNPTYTRYFEYFGECLKEQSHHEDKIGLKGNELYKKECYW